MWKEWLFDEEAKKTFAQVGYYTQKLKLKNGKVYNNVNILAVNS